MFLEGKRHEGMHLLSCRGREAYEDVSGGMHGSEDGGCSTVVVGRVEEGSRQVCFDVPFLVGAHDPIQEAEDACPEPHHVHLERL